MLMFCLCVRMRACAWKAFDKKHYVSNIGAFNQPWKWPTFDSVKAASKRDVVNACVTKKHSFAETLEPAPIRGNFPFVHNFFVCISVLVLSRIRGMKIFPLFFH